MYNFSDIAQERGTDANELMKAKRQLAAIYMAGYQVECSLKGLLPSAGKSFPTSGRDGHNLHALWEAAGFKREDAGGLKRLVLDNWSTDLRYQSEISPDLDVESLFKGAMELAGYVKVRLRNSRGKRK